MTAALTTASGARWALAYLGGDYPWSYFPWFPWLAYPLLGFAWRVAVERAAAGGAMEARRASEESGPVAETGHNPRLRVGLQGSAPATAPVVLWAIAITCGIVTAATWRYGVTVCNDLPRYYHHDVRFFFWTCALLAAWIALHAACQAWCGDRAVAVWLKGLGRNVTLCYVVQWLLIGNLATALYKTESLLPCGLSIVAVVSVTGLFSAFLGHKHPAAKGAAGAIPSGDLA
jgi:hypothetical protein